MKRRIKKLRDSMEIEENARCIIKAEEGLYLYEKISKEGFTRIDKPINGLKIYDVKTSIKNIFIVAEKGNIIVFIEDIDML